jgi:ubiquinone/menaquinone biosynthesis C-methylase UbiE
VPSPNIWHTPATYELENRAFDRAGRVEAAMREVADWRGLDVVDIGCGTGYHLSRFAESAGSVTGVDPHPGLVAAARRRTAGRANVRVEQGLAQRLPLPDASVDVTHARWAYFLGPGCEPGLPELDRVLRRGGTAFVVDNDATRSTFGRWFRRAYHRVDPGAVERFWATRGWTRVALEVEWRFDTRADLEAVVRIEVDPATADAALAEHEGLVVDYAVSLWWRRA